MTFTDIFGGANINPSLLSYVSYTIATDTTLLWPFEATENSNVAADKIDVDATAASLKLYMPAATLVSVGQDVLVNNVGANDFTVVDNAGNTLISIPPGNQYYLYLTDNSSPNGSWRVVLFGSITSPLTASALAGLGLRANVAKLDQNLPALSINGNYTFGVNDRASVARSNSGAVTWTFGPAATLGNGWFVYIINAGTGIITLTPDGTETLDNDSSKIINPGESLIVFSDGANLWSLGYGRAISSTVTALSLNIAGSGVTTLTSTQAAAQVQNFDGALTGPSTIDYTSIAGYWFVYNNTTGGFNLTFRANGADPGVIVAQGSFSILRSDGTTMSVAFTATTGTVTEVDTGTGLSGGPITTTGTIYITNTAVAPGSYGTTAAKTASFTVNAQGQMIAASEQDIAIDITQVNTFSSADIYGRMSDPMGVAGSRLVFAESPALSGTPLSPTNGTATDASTQIATDAFVQAAIAAAVAALVSTGDVFTTGDIKHTLNDTLQTSWLYLNGQTLGSATSGADHANVIYQPLYEFFWNKYSNSLCPVSTGRGATAALDFAANKTLTMLDARGSILAGAENMGGASRGNLGTNPSAGGFAATASLGTSAGAKDHMPIINEMASHDHAWVPREGDSTPSTGAGNVRGGGWLGATGPGNVGNSTSSPTGGGVNFNITQPTLVCNVWVHI